MLVALAAWFPLLAYPVPGSQIYFGSFLLIPLAILCLAELLNQLPSRLPGALVSGLLVAGLTALLGWQALQARERYQSGQALALPGAQQLRLPAVQAGRYRKLVAEMDKSDVALATSGFNSLYLWSGAKPPAPVLFNLSPRFLTPEQQQQIVLGLQGAERPVVLLRKARRGAERTTVELWVESHFRQTNKIGPYRVMRPGPAPAKSTDTKKGG